MSNSKLEEIARAITETWSSHFGDGVAFDELPPLTKACRLAEARAAVEAMREPTRDMLMMGQEEVLISFDEASCISTYASAAEIENAWQAMIDSILGSTPS